MGILEMFQKFCEKLKDCIWFESLLFFKNNIEILFSRFFKDLILNLCLVWFDLVVKFQPSTMSGTGQHFQCGGGGGVGGVGGGGC